MSNDTYERYGKLNATLGKLVLDGKRHLPTVNAALQKLIFSTTQWPRAKNWVVIRELAKTSPQMSAIVTAIDLSKTDWVAQQIIAAFPDCFVEEEVKGPIPLSGILAKAAENARERGEDEERAKAFPQSYGALDDLNLPYVTYVTDSKADGASDYPLLPLYLDHSAKQGEKMSVHGVDYVVVENNQNPHVNEMVLTPAEHIDATC